MGRVGEGDPILGGEPSRVTAAARDETQATYLGNMEERFKRGFIKTEDELIGMLDLYYTNILDQTVPPEHRDKEGAIKQEHALEYQNRKNKAEADALTAARNIIYQKEQFDKGVTGAAGLAKPALSYASPISQAYSEEEGYMVKVGGALQQGLGYNAQSIRSNLDQLPPDDDRRGPLTEILMMYEEFETKIGMAKTAQEAKESLEELSQGFQTSLQRNRETLSSAERTQEREIQDEINDWQQKQQDFANKLDENIRRAQTAGYWGPGTGMETLEKTRKDFEMEQAALAGERETTRQTFEQEMRVGQQGLQQRQLTLEETRAGQQATIAGMEAERQTAAIGREERDWQGEQDRLNAALTGYLETEKQKDPTLEMQEFWWATAFKRAEQTGLFVGPKGGDAVETLAFRSQKFQEGLSTERQQNTARLEEIKLEMNENDNETKIAIADKQVAIEQGKLADAVQARRVQMKLEGDKLDFQKSQMRLEAIQSLTNPKTLLVFQRTGMIPMLERILGMSLNMPEFPELLPPGQTIPTQQYLNMASPGDRELIMAEASLRSGFSEMDVRSVLQRQMPGGLGVAIGYRGEGR
jgi:hypothetical protein